MPAPPLPPVPLAAAVAALPAGRWAVGVSGGADSVALLRLLADHRPDVSPHVVHLDHQLRGGDSAADAAFVADLSDRLRLPATVARLSDRPADPRGNPSARYRDARLALFREVVVARGLAGVVVAHHADDQAETVFARLLRGGGATTLVGMATTAVVADVTVARPLLTVAGADLRAYLRAIGQPWREDASNASAAYQRNRLRVALRDQPGLRAELLALAAAARALRKWQDANVPALGESFAATDLAGLPGPLAAVAAGRWLQARGAPADDVNDDDRRRLVRMATATDAPRQWTFPGGLLVRRRRGRVEVAASGAAASAGHEAVPR